MRAATVTADFIAGRLAGDILALAREIDRASTEALADDETTERVR